MVVGTMTCCYNGYLYNGHKPLRIIFWNSQDFIRLQNKFNNSLPTCFNNAYYLKLNRIYFNVQTRDSSLGCCQFSPSKKTNLFTTETLSPKNMKTDLLIMSDCKLKPVLSQHFNKDVPWIELCITMLEFEFNLSCPHLDALATLRL